MAQFLFPVAMNETERFRIVSRRPDERRHGRSAGLFIRRASFLNPRQLALDPLAKTCVMRPVGDDDVKSDHAAETSEQIEVCRPQSPGIRRVIGDGHHDTVEWQHHLSLEQPPLELVFIEAAARGNAPLVPEKRESEETCLVDETLAAPIGAALHPELIEKHTRKAADVALPPT